MKKNTDNKTINGIMLRKMILGAANLLDKNKEEINKLNVFPVPDGDTGTNMSLTMQRVVQEINKCPTNSVVDISNHFEAGAIRGARGNSGVILSQIIRGMSDIFKTTKNDLITVKDFSKAIANGCKLAYSGVKSPMEGTILTVIKDMSTAAASLAKKYNEMDDFLSGVSEAGLVSLKNTPNLLPVLKEAGVVDSGGQGLLFVFQGFYNAVMGRAEDTVDFKVNFGMSVDLSNFLNEHPTNLSDIEFAYCTQFSCLNFKKSTTQADLNKFMRFLTTIGDSVGFVGDLKYLKVHVHTNDPGKALSNAVLYGEVEDIKIENMLIQAREIANAVKVQKEIGVIAVCSGVGLVKQFEEMTVDYIIDGGQTMNPSAETIAEAAEKVNAKHVIVLPNNKNIVLAAQQAKNLTTKCNIHVLATTNVPEGLAAMMGYDSTLDIKANLVNMKSKSSVIKSGSITKAEKNTTSNGISIKKDNFIGINTNKIVASNDSLKDIALELVQDMTDEDSTNITLYYGKEVVLADVEALQAEISTKYKNCDVDIQNGGQDLYHYLVSVE